MANFRSYVFFDYPFECSTIYDAVQTSVDFIFDCCLDSTLLEYYFEKFHVELDQIEFGKIDEFVLDFLHVYDSIDNNHLRWTTTLEKSLYWYYKNSISTGILPTLDGFAEFVYHNSNA